jgi:hypothetical protein
MIFCTFKNVCARWGPGWLKTELAELRHMEAEREDVLTGLLLEIIHRSSTSNWNHSMHSYSGIIPVHLSPEQFKDLLSVHKVMLTVFEIVRCPVYPFSKACCTICHCHIVLAVLFCPFLWTLGDSVCRKWHGQLRSGLLVLHNDARPHGACATQEQYGNRWQLLNHQPYSPDFTSSDFHIFGQLKEHGGKSPRRRNREVEDEKLL